MDRLHQALQNLRDYWQEQAEMWAEQERAWHEVVLFARKKRMEIRNIRLNLIAEHAE